MKRARENPVIIVALSVLVGAVLNLAFYESLKRKTENANLYHKGIGSFAALPFIRWYSQRGIPPELAALCADVGLGVGSVVGRCVRHILTVRAVK